LTHYSLLVAIAFAAFCAALCVAAVDESPPGAAVLAEAGVDVDQVYERCTSSSFGWCMRAEYAATSPEVLP